MVLVLKFAASDFHILGVDFCRMPQEEADRYEEQLVCMCDILVVYKVRPDSFPELATLMQNVWTGGAEPISSP